MREQPEQRPPPVQRLRVRYAKRGPLRFTSHRDFARAFERAVSRARLPVAYSSGFHPHPRISYAGAAPTGAATEAEYLEIGLAELVDPDRTRVALDEALPPGLDVVEAVVSPGGSLADLLEASRWRTSLSSVGPEVIARGVRALLGAEEVMVERMTTKGLRRFDCRAAVVSVRVMGRAETEARGIAGQRSHARASGPSGECAILDMVLRHGTPSVRPDDVLAGLRRLAGLDASAVGYHERLAQGPLEGTTGTVGDPLARNRDTA